MNLFRGRPRLEYGEVDLAPVEADDSSMGSFLETKDQFFIRIRPKRYFRSDASTVSSITYHGASGFTESSWCCHTSKCIPEPRTEPTKVIARQIHKTECNECYNCHSCRTASNTSTDGNKLVANASTDRRKTKENDSDTVPTRETASLFDNLSSTSEDDDDEVQRIRGAPSRRRKWRLIRNISGKKKNRRKNEMVQSGIQTEILS
ncbi:hypothetical protein FisN_22Lu179 [Fistulifera solaris]|uniref:Uncharacterized protein n=1 Tax=Fistulifera solaris TaxID=1519565 RepID=A0A1Z5JBZ6_FISSO|nr:hypothetical protein FisN_22Lu179 [Fistulifera solaris]|eukprot:GAX11476.1 hypothetical protein FisN_22Lu179 [Fistulifera solaris]